MIPSRTHRTRASVAAAAVLVTLLAALLAGCGSDGSDAASTKSGSGATTTTTADGSLPSYDADASPDPAVGMAIPTVTGETFAGDKLTIQADGKAKVLLFVAHWCPHCQREVPLLSKYLDDNPMPDDVELITISTNVQAGADNYPPQEWLKKVGWQAPTIADHEDNSIATTYGLSSFPYFVVVGADGKVLERGSGERTTDEFAAMVKLAQGS